MLADELWYEIISIWAIKRKFALDMWITILEFDQIWRHDPAKAHEFDLKYEEYQQSLPLSSKMILDSKMSFYCQPDAFKVFLDVSEKVWAERIFAEKRVHDANSSFDEVLATNKKRHQWQQKTYMRLYDIDIFDMKHYSLVIDTSDKSPQEVFACIREHFNNFIEQRWNNQ